MGLSDAMQWWDEWKLRVLVLGSLSVQFFLYFSDLVRLWYKLRWLRMLVWMAHIGGDALAVYALATLFNRQKQLTADGGSEALELIWVPILLIHLGGQSISAYSLEDNELWMRHAITLVSQVVVALYIFCKWWSGQKRLLQAAVLLFVVGILKFSQKPWALRSASFNSMASRSLSVPRDKGSFTPWWAWCTTDCLDFISARMKTGEQEHKCNLSLQDYVKEARSIVVQEKEVPSESARRLDHICMMLVDLSCRDPIRLNYLQYFLKLDDEGVHKGLRTWVWDTYRILYTRMRSYQTPLGLCSVWFLPFLALASLVLFAKSDKDGYNDKDITVSYILLGCTAMIQFAAWFAPFLRMPCDISGRLKLATWQDMVSQQNLMSFCAREKQQPTTTFMKIVACMCPMEYINKHCYNWQETAALQIEVLICEYIKDGWKEYISGPTTYRRFNNFRGQHTLSRHPQHLWSLEELGFDDTVLVWHIATDLCFHHPDTSSQQGPSGDTILRSTQISNYMIYLIFVCPEMLMAGTRQDLFTVACNDIKAILTDQDDPQGIARQILLMERDALKGIVVQYAHKLAKQLMDHPNEEQRWKVIQGVWVEMLCYSASRCRGYLHAKSLGEGGEFLTNVWFLWSFMGMEILGDKINQPLEKEGITDALV
ncbi:hypothetical protein CFC21_080792 [Triticum aestivum]|uniref:DUF4220 domain-containing protein n=4 Tax=Triticinae TaxID=1648030 RepID=A0A453MEF4_AEGTS|nr:uncharacterized protein LOC109774655 [Aegilops tauschii subsp. strangulata]KAF7076094.1 hypothetical protein CFC21_080792 [Triticum aestivum]